jgi:plastocyanin
MRRYLALASAFVAAGAIMHAQPTATGTIVGRVVLTSRIKSTSLPSTIYQPRAVAIHQPAATPEISNVVVSLKGLAYTAPLATSSREIRQVHEEFIPRVVAVTRGSTVGFPNGDPIFHNVFSLASAATFDLGRYPQGKTKAATFNKPGVVKVYCHIHSQMSATIVVFDHPYFVTPERDGTFRLADVPVGSYSVAGWHERVGERIVPVKVTAGGTAEVVLSLPVEDAP